MKKLLAITPYFGKTGSEIALLNVLNAISSSVEIDLFTPNRQPTLGSELSESISLYYPKPTKTSISNKLKKRISKSSSSKHSILDRWISKSDYSYALLNTFGALKHFEAAKRLAQKTIVYIHETEAMLPTIGPAALDQILNEADLVLCSSNHVKKYFKTLGRHENITVLHPSLDYSKFNTKVKAHDLREALGFKKTDYVWAMAGTMTFNKNPKTFLKIARKLNKMDARAKFIWMGYRAHRPYDSYIKESITELELEGVVQVIESQDDAYFEYINMMDGFVLTSFSESFSLVSLEAACFGKPVVSFPCGGIEEAVPSELVKIASEYSVNEIAALMFETMQDKDRPALTSPQIARLLETDARRVGHRFQEILNSNQI